MDKDVICRLCLCENEIALNLFIGMNDHNETLHKIEKNLQVSLPEFPNWPSNICTCCMELLREIQAFQESVELNQRKLRNMFDNVIIAIEDDEITEPVVSVEKSPIHTIDDDIGCAPENDYDIVSMDDLILSPSSQFGSEKDLSPYVPMSKYQRSNDSIAVREPDEVISNSTICSFCGKILASNSTLHKHEYSFHNPNRIKYSCNVCGSLTVSIRKHMRMYHRKETPSECSICGKVFKRRNNLYAHMKIVHGNQKHTCVVCGKVYKLARYLREHMPVHTGMSLHKCFFCDDRFNTAGLRTQHCKRRHGDEYLEWKNKSKDWRTRRVVKQGHRTNFELDSSNNSKESDSESEMINSSAAKYTVFPIEDEDQMNEYVQGMGEDDDLVQYLKKEFYQSAGLRLAGKHQIWRDYFSDKLMDRYSYDGKKGTFEINDNPIFWLLFECWQSDTFTDDSWEKFVRDVITRKNRRKANAGRNVAASSDA